MTDGGDVMRDFTNTQQEHIHALRRRTEESVGKLLPNADDETCRVQADGFFGDEKGFHDVEELRRKQFEARQT